MLQWFIVQTPDQQICSVTHHLVENNLVDRHLVDQSIVVSTLDMAVSAKPGKTKGGSITVPLTSCLTGLESAV